MQQNMSLGFILFREGPYLCTRVYSVIRKDNKFLCKGREQRRTGTGTSLSRLKAIYQHGVVTRDAIDFFSSAVRGESSHNIRSI